MRRVYQRLRALAVCVCLLAVASACGSQDSGGIAVRPASPPPVDAELLLAASSHELPAFGLAGERIVATEIAPGAVRAVVLPRERPGGPRAVTPSELACVAVAALAGDFVLVDCRDPRSGESGLRLRDGGGRLERLPASAALGRETLLATSDGGAAIWTATSPRDGEPARLLATALRPLARRPVFTAPAGFEIVAVEPVASLAVLRRELTPEAHEVVLHDWRRNDSRLLLPSAADGRFRELRFADDGRALLLLADDGGDLPRLERLDLASGERRAWGALRCPPQGLRAHRDGTLTAIVDCDGRRLALRLDAAGREVPLPALPSGVRAVDWLPAGDDGALVVATAGERWPAEIGWADASGDFRPLTYGLSPRVAPAGLPEPHPIRLASGGESLPAELWTADGAPRALVVWFEDGAAPPRFGEHRPLAAALAVRGVATLVVRGRGSDGPSRRLRRAADGDPAAAALADFRAVAAATRELTPATTPRLLVGEGAWWGAAAQVVAGATDSPFTAVAALFPGDDPLAEASQAEGAEEPLRAHLQTRWGDVALAGDALRLAWATAGERVRVPTWIALDAASPAAVATSARLAAAQQAGAPLAVVTTSARPAGLRLPGELERALAAWLLAAAPRAPR